MQVGARLKQFRKKKRITLKELAVKSGLSVGFLSNLERDATSPTLVHLQRICASLNVDMATLLHDEDPSALVRAEERREIFNIDSAVRYELVTHGDRLMKGICMTIAAEHMGEEISWGHSSDELGIIISGSMHMDLNGANYELKQGDTIYIPQGVPHKYWKTSPEECVSYWVLCNIGEAQASGVWAEGSKDIF